jgi:hypothetical protein
MQCGIHMGQIFISDGDVKDFFAGQFSDQGLSIVFKINLQINCHLPRIKALV